MQNIGQGCADIARKCGTAPSVVRRMKMKYADEIEKRTGVRPRAGLMSKTAERERNEDAANAAQIGMDLGTQADWAPGEVYSIEIAKDDPNRGDYAGIVPGEKIVLAGKVMEVLEVQTDAKETLRISIMEAPKEEKKPPRGLTPRYVFDLTRIHEICAAVSRYLEAGLEPEEEWLRELNELIEREIDRRGAKADEGV